MKKKDGAGPERGGLGFGLLMGGSTLVTLWLAFFWYVSPLAVGFSDWPDDVERHRLILRLYALSWHWGIPALLVAQASAWFLAWRGRQLAAELVAVLANLGFAGLIAVIMGQLG